MNLLEALVSALRRRLLGISAEEIRYTFQDVRNEVAALRTEVRDEIQKLHRELDSLPQREDRARGPEVPVAEA